ncbi:hypothetical protein COOONC_27453 [Cooperia oncophora]
MSNACEGSSAEDPSSISLDQPCAESTSAQHILANISHRIEKLFGPRNRGLVAPLAGAEQITKSGKSRYLSLFYQGGSDENTWDLWYIYDNLSIFSHFFEKALAEGEHSRGGILFEYEFCAM